MLDGIVELAETLERLREIVCASASLGFLSTAVW